MTLEEKLRLLLVHVEELQARYMDLSEDAVTHSAEDARIALNYEGRAVAYEHVSGKIREILEH